MSATGIRLNNPLNLTYRPQDKWVGLASPPNDGRFCRFIDATHGYRAAYKELLNYIARGHCTIPQIIPIWAPKVENPTDSYIQNVEKWSGFTSDHPIKPETDAFALFKAMTREEDGTDPYPDYIIEAGIQMAQGQTPQALTVATNQRSNTVMVTLAAALLAPKVERATGIKLSTEDVATLIGAAAIIYHAAISAFVRYFPPPNPIQPPQGAQETDK